MAASSAPSDVALPKLKPLLGLLISNFTRGDYAQRRESAIALSKFKGDMVAHVLLQTYESDNIQDFMALALGDIENQKAIDLLIHALNDTQHEVRFNAARALGNIKSEEAFNVLVEALNEYADASSSGVAQGRQGQLFLEEDAIISAINTLGKIRNPLCVPLMKRILGQEKSPRIRSAVIMTLGMMTSERLLPVLQGALRDEDPRVRANAIEAIEKLKSSSIVGILQPYLEDTNNRVRANVAKAIWKFGDFDVSETLGKMLSSSDKWHRASAAYALGEIKDARFIGKLAQSLKDEDSDVRRNAAHALKKLESPNSLNPLLPLLDDPNFDVRVQAVLAITRCVPNRVEELLLPRLTTEENPIVRATLISSFGETNTTAARDLIFPYLEDADSRVVANAINALRKLIPQNPDPQLVSGVSHLLFHEDNRVKSDAIHALWHWKVFSVLDHLLGLLGHEDPKHRLSGTFVLGEIGRAISDNPTLAKAVNQLIADLVAGKESSAVEAPAPTAPIAPGKQGEKPAVSTDRPPRDREAPATATPEALPVDASLEAKIELAGSYVNEKEFAEAEKIYSSVLSGNPGHLKARLGLADLFFITKRYSESTIHYEMALQINPNLVKAHYNLGTILYFQKNHDRAKEHLLQALHLYPKLLGAYLILAQIYQLGSRTAESIQLLSKAIELSPRNPILYQKLALLHLHVKEVDRAIEVLQRAVALSPLDIESHVWLALSLNLVQRPAEAFTALDQALKACSQSASSEEALQLMLQSYTYFKSNVESL